MDTGVIGKMIIKLIEKHGIEKTLLVSATAIGGAMIGGISGGLISNKVFVDDPCTLINEDISEEVE